MDTDTVGNAEHKSNIPNTMKEARRLGYKRYYTGKPCKRGHVTERLSNNGHCLECHRKGSIKWRKENPDKVREYTARTQAAHNEYCKEWVKKNPESRRVSTKKYRETHREQDRRIQREWRAKNPDKAKQSDRRQYWNDVERRRAAASKSKKKNREYFAAVQKERECRKRQAVPLWADKEMILEYYSEARKLTDETGEPHHVDHIVPLTSDLVCGLHVQDNLQVLPQRLNQIKKNSWWPDMPDKDNTGRVRETVEVEA